MEGPKFSKRRQLGKNKKKSWRGIDITETEDFLEDQRFQERTTGLFSEKTDDQLFIVERQRADALTTEVPKKKARQELNCYSNLVNRSRIQCPRKEYPTSDDYKTRSLRAFTLRSDSQRKTTSPEEKDPEEAEVKDLWGEEKTPAEVADFFDEVTKRKRVKPPQNIRLKCSQRAKVEVPHPGASVNPAYDDHQNLLLEAHLVEQKKDKAERKIFNSLDAKFPTASEAPSQATWIAEMSAGLYENPGAEDDKVDDSHISINPPVSREKKKTPRQKRKEKAAKLMEHVMAEKKSKKGTENKVYSIAKIRSQLAQDKREMAQRAEEKAKTDEAKKYLPKKLGKTKYPFGLQTPDLELKLSEELVGSLRSVKPEGHLLEDRYKSMQMRNILEPRAKSNKKKVKTKKFEKKSFREITV
ncbi:hypothetical protein ACOMHN_057781 [Nucella lapillus]